MNTENLPANISIGSVQIHQHGGLYSLNDLHKASGGEEKHQPNRFLRLDTTQALIIEISKTPYLADNKPIETTRGRYASTYACKELVIAYAAWISAEFHLRVIRVFLESVTPAQPQPLPPGPHPDAHLHRPRRRHRPALAVAHRPHGPRDRHPIIP